MRLNRELRTKKMVIRFHLLWVLFYVLSFGLITAFVVHTYREHSENQFPPGNVEIAVDKTEYQLGDPIIFTIKNNFPTSIYATNGCPGEPLNVYKWNGVLWYQIHDTATSKDANCYKQPRRVPIKSGETVTYNFNDWPKLFDKPGVYRIVLAIDHYDDLPFQDFKILEEPEVITKPGSTTKSPSSNTSSPSSTTTPSTPKEPENERERTDEPNDDNEVE